MEQEMKKKTINENNRGKTCKTPRCPFAAKVKGYCRNCYMTNRIRKIKAKKMKWNYLTEKEIEMTPDLVDLQIILGLQTCQKKEDVLELLKDVRQHERLQRMRRKK